MYDGNGEKEKKKRKEEMNYSNWNFCYVLGSI